MIFLNISLNIKIRDWYFFKIILYVLGIYRYFKKDVKWYIIFFVEIKFVKLVKENRKKYRVL